MKKRIKKLSELKLPTGKAKSQMEINFNTFSQFISHLVLQKLAWLSLLRFCSEMYVFLHTLCAFVS